ncbi:hypothetical protein A6R68_01978 [Neotoma lepida]|uniref:Uncharacterized protein n=1 Tax=Neotoma lepida TaxID=56216 RepID=A0A1A6GTP2_NEOLE|nr:hypothetical protein A6R68_01978 [Neotoma lepida]
MVATMYLDLKKAVTELQAKVTDAQQKVKLADIQIEQLNRTKRHAHLTDPDIMTLIDETNIASVRILRKQVESIAFENYQSGYSNVLFISNFELQHTLEREKVEPPIFLENFLQIKAPVRA